MQLKFRIYSKRQKQYVENSCGTHCFSSWAIDPFTGKVVHYTGFLGDESGAYHKEEDPGHYIKGCDFIKESEFIVEEFTGDYDLNGKPIFVGDIIKQKYSGDIGVVRHYLESDGCDCNCYAPDPNVIGSGLTGAYVIGNINENPELIEEQFATV